MALSWKLPMVIEPPAPRTIRGAKIALPATRAEAAMPPLINARRRSGRLSSLPVSLVLSLIFFSLLVDKESVDFPSRSGGVRKSGLEGRTGLRIEKVQVPRHGSHPAWGAYGNRKVRRLADVHERIVGLDRDQGLVAERLDDIDLAGQRSARRGLDQLGMLGTEAEFCRAAMAGG